MPRSTPGPGAPWSRWRFLCCPIAVKGWVNNQPRRTLADKSSQDILVPFSMILGEAVDEGLIGANPCRKLRITFAERPERPHASPADQVDQVGRVHRGQALLCGLDELERHRDTVGAGASSTGR